MVQYRKSKKAGPFRFTVSQCGISTSVGAGPLRITYGADGRVRRTVRAPGLGLYDTKVIGGKRLAPKAAKPGEVSTLGYGPRLRAFETIDAELRLLAGACRRGASTTGRGVARSSGAQRADPQYRIDRSVAG
jgi:Protein of unknown function (DUF4236)